MNDDPAHMLPKRAGWSPEDIVAAREVRLITPETPDFFSPAREPRIQPRPTREFAHLPTWTGGQWVPVSQGPQG